MNKNVRIAFQLRHKDDSNSKGIGDLSYSDFQWNKRRYLYHSNGSNEYVLFKDSITDSIHQMIGDIIVRGKDKEILNDPCLVYLYQFDDNGNSYYSDQVNQKWKDWMKVNHERTKPHQLYTYVNGLEVGCTPILHEKCVFTTVRFTGDTSDYADIGKLSEALINQFINIENNLTLRVIKLYDHCMKIAHELHLLDVNQDVRLVNIWDRMSNVMGQADEVANWIPTIDYYMDKTKEYEINLLTSDPNYLYKYNLTSLSKKAPVYKTTIAAEKSGYDTSVSSFTNNFVATSSGGTSESGWINYAGNDDMLLVREDSVLSISSTLTQGLFYDISVYIRIINKFDRSKYIEKTVKWFPSDGLTGSFTANWKLSASDINRLGGTDKFCVFAINIRTRNGGQKPGLYSIVKLAGWKKNTTVFGELEHTSSGQLLSGFINIGDQAESTTTETRPDLYLVNSTSYNYQNQYNSVFETPIRGDNDHKVNRVRGSVAITGMRPANEWLSSPTLKTDVLCYNMSGNLVKTLTAQYGHNTISVNKTGGNQNRYFQYGRAGDKYMDYQQSFDIGGQTKVYIGVNSNVITKYSRDHHGTSGCTNHQYVGNIISGSSSTWRDGSGGGTTIGLPSDPGYPNTSSLDALKKSQLYLEVNVSDIPNNSEWKQLYGKTLWTTYGNLSGYVYIKRQGLTATVLVRYNWVGGGWDGRDHYQFSWIHRLGIFTSYPSSNVLLLQPSDTNKVFNFDFNLGGLFKVKIRHTATWGTYNSGAYGTLQSFSCKDTCTGNTTYYLPDKINIPSIFTPINKDCTVMIRGGQKYRIFSQAQDLQCTQLGIHKVRESKIDITYLNTMFYGDMLVLNKDFILRTGTGRSYKLDTIGNPPTIKRIVSGVPSPDTSKIVRQRSLMSVYPNDPILIKPEPETGMGYITKLMLYPRDILEEFSNKWLTIYCSDNTEISFKIGYISNEEWTSLYNNDKQRVYGIVRESVLYVMTYYIDTTKIVINHQSGNTMEFILRDYKTNEITHSFSLLPYKPENGIPVKVGNDTYYLELSLNDDEINSESADPVVFRDAHDKLIGYLK